MRNLVIFLLLVPLCAQQPGPLRTPSSRTVPTERRHAGDMSAQPGAEPENQSAAQDALPFSEQADLVVVAKTIRGTVSPEETAVAFDVYVQVQRVLRGDGVSPGEELHLVFRDDRPRFPLRKPEAVEASRGIVFLRRNGESYEPIRLPTTPRPTGSFLLHLPEDSSATESSATFMTSVGWELAAALEHWGASDGRALDGAGGERGLWGSRQISVKAVYFEQAASFLVGHMTDPAPFTEIYPQLFRSPSAHVRLVGVLGLLKLQRPEALEALASDLPLYLKCVGSNMIFEPLQGWDVSRNPGTADTLGRLALSESASRNVEYAAAWSLGTHPLVDSLPYLVELLDSPHPNSRSGALLGICTLNRGGDPRASLKDYSGEEARLHCPNRLPVVSPAEEKEHLAFWKNWWNTNRDRIEKDFRQDGTGKVLAFARAAAPARWVNVREAAPQRSQGTPEEAVRMLLRMFDSNTMRGKQSPEQEQMRARGLLRMEADDTDIQALLTELRRGAEALHAVDAEFRAALMKQRLNGEQPDLSIVSMAEQRSAKVIADFLQAAERSLSPDAWRGFQAGIKERAESMVHYTVPTPRRAQ